VLRRTFSLGLIDLTDIEVRVIKSVCAISKAQAKNYKVLDQLEGPQLPDIVLVNADSPPALIKWSSFSQRTTVPAVHVARDVSGLDVDALKRPLVPARLLKLLDKVTQDLAPPVELRRSSFRALVVDDSPTVRKQLELALKDADGEVFCVETGEAAIEAVTKQHFDMVFLDVVLPGADGYAVCRSIKKGRQTKELPVIMLTSKSSPFDKIRGNLAGCDSYLTKPVEANLFRATIQKYLPNGAIYGTLVGA
jgi:twitching motility two-component system response regulator PilG